MSKMIAWNCKESGEVLLSGSTYPFDCCGASYRNVTSATLAKGALYNTHGVLVVKGKVGQEQTSPEHNIKHVHTRAGVLTISTVEKRFDSNHVDQLPRNLL